MATGRRSAWRPGGPPHPFVPPAPAYNRLKIAFRITGGQLQGTVEIAYRTDRTQVLTTILWWGRLDDFLLQALTDALRVAARSGDPVRFHTFAAAARDLFRHTSQRLIRRFRRRRRRRAPCPAREVESNTLWTAPGGTVGLLQGELLTRIEELHKDARCRAPMTVTEGAETDRLVCEAMSALQLLFALLGSFLEQVLGPLEPHIGRDTAQALVLERVLVAA